MLSAMDIHNLSVVMPRPIPWYGILSVEWDDIPQRLPLPGDLRLAFEGLRYPDERCRGSGSQFSHEATAMHLDGDLAD